MSLYIAQRFCKWFCHDPLWNSSLSSHLRLGYNLDFLPIPSFYLWHYFIPSFPSICSIFLGLHLWMIPFSLLPQGLCTCLSCNSSGRCSFFTWLNSVHPQHSASVSLHQEVFLKHIHHPEKAVLSLPPVISLSSTLSFEICLSCYTGSTKGSWPCLFFHLCNHRANRGSRGLTDTNE